MSPSEGGRQASTSCARASWHRGSPHAWLFDVQGNAFDIDAFRSRIQIPILAWLDGQHTPPADFMPPAALGRHYEVLVAAASEHQDLRPHIALTPGPAWLWYDFYTSYVAHAAAPWR